LVDAVAVACDCGVSCLFGNKNARRTPWQECSHSLSQVFAEFGSITEANVVYDRETGRSRGFGFVAYTEEAAASSAIKVLLHLPFESRRPEWLQMLVALGFRCLAALLCPSCATCQQCVSSHGRRRI